jgi:arginyl-tRNA synthetase
MGGYVNFRLAPSIWLSILSEHKICSKSARNETVIVDYIGLNIGKPSHIGHLCTPTIGQTIINTYRYLGFRVIGDNHLGDWGGIFGKLIAAFKLFGNETDLIANPIEYLLSLYIKVTAEAEKDPSIDQRCRDEFKKLTEADPENMELWKRFTTFTLQAVQPQMDLIGAHADYAIGESYYE